MKKTLKFVFDDWDGINKYPFNSKNFYDEETNIGPTQIMEYYNYYNYSLHKIEDVPKNPNEKYYYLLWNIVAREPKYDKKKFPINKNIIKYLQENKNLFIIFIDTEESSGIDIILKIQNFCKDYNINQKQIWNINNNSKLKEIGNILNTNINLHISKGQSLTIQKYKNKCNFIPVKNNGKFFLCFNNSPKEHRIMLLILLKKYNILNDINWSMLKKYENIVSLNPSLIRYDFNLFKKEIDYFSNISCKKSDYEEKIQYHNIDDHDWEKQYDNKTYENSYFNIITESFFFERYMHISEKSFRPFNYYQFPLIISSHHHIKYMKLNYDFDFFDDVLDHSYDNVVDNFDRLYKFVEEIKRIQENKKFFIKFYEENQDRFLENNKKYQNLNNQYDINFFNSLI